MLFQVVHCHPLIDSYNHALFRTIVAALEQRGHSVIATGLYRERFDPAMREDERASYYQEPYAEAAVAPSVPGRGGGAGTSSSSCPPGCWPSPPALVVVIWGGGGGGVAFGPGAGGGKTPPLPPPHLGGGEVGESRRGLKRLPPGGRPGRPLGTRALKHNRGAGGALLFLSRARRQASIGRPRGWGFWRGGARISKFKARARATWIASTPARA